MLHAVIHTVNISDLNRISEWNHFNETTLKQQKSPRKRITENQNPTIYELWNPSSKLYWGAVKLEVWKGLKKDITATSYKWRLFHFRHKRQGKLFSVVFLLYWLQSWEYIHFLPQHCIFLVGKMHILSYFLHMLRRLITSSFRDKRRIQFVSIHKRTCLKLCLTFNPLYV